jgi:hypothetical protein
MTTASLAKLTPVASSPEHHVLENLAVPQRQVWYVPAPAEDLPVEPILLHTFDDGHLAQCFVALGLAAGLVRQSTHLTIARLIRLISKRSHICRNMLRPTSLAIW